MKTEQVTKNQYCDYKCNGTTLPIGYVFKNNSDAKNVSIEITGKGIRGGFAVTYKGERTTFIKGIKQCQTIAIKEFFPCNEKNKLAERDNNGLHVKPTPAGENFFKNFKKKFEEEANILKKYYGPNIIHVDDCFEENGTIYYYMNYFGNGSLKDYVENRNFTTFKEVWNFLQPLFWNLKSVHEDGFFHCDISSDNILIGKDNSGNYTPILIDFGSCRAVNAAVTTLTNQPSFSPMEVGCREWYMKEYNKRKEDLIKATVDIYSLGLIIYFMMHRAAFEIDKDDKDDRPMWQRIFIDGFDFPEGMDPKAKKVIEKACQTDIDERPQSMEEFIKFCESVLNGNSETEYDANTIINIMPKITIENLAKEGPIPITLPLDDVTLSSAVLGNKSWKDLLGESTIEKYDYQISDLKFKRIKLEAVLDGSGNYHIEASSSHFMV